MDSYSMCFNIRQFLFMPRLLQVLRGMDRGLLSKWRIQPEAKNYLYLQQVRGSCFFRILVVLRGLLCFLLSWVHVVRVWTHHITDPGGLSLLSF